MCHHQHGSTGPVSQVLLTRAILVCAPRGPGPVLGLGLGNIGTAPLGGHSTLNTGPRVTGDNQCYQARGAKSGHLVMKCSHESSAAWSLQSTIEECTITFRVLQGPSCSQCPKKLHISLWFSPILTCPVLPEPPSVPPEITGVPLQLTSGEWLKVQCHLPWMNVKPQLEFFVNDKKAKHMVSKY